MNDLLEHEVSIPLVEQTAPLRSAPDRTNVGLSLTDTQSDATEDVNGGETRPLDANDVAPEADSLETVSRRSYNSNPEVNAASNDEGSCLTTTSSVPKERRQLPQYLAILFVIGFLVMLALCIVALRKTRSPIGLDSVPIGGRYLQREAKAIDFACGALAAPAVFFLWDWYIFGVARIAVANEQSSTRMPLLGLAEASATDAGTYNPHKIWKLIKNRKWKLWLFALLAVLSAISLMALSNVIAYEANPDISRGRMLETKVRLRMLNGDPGTVTSLSQLSLDQRERFVGESAQTLAGMVYRNVTDRLQNDTYIGINVTKTSLEAIPQETVKLLNVPGYRLLIRCQAEPPNNWYAIQLGQVSFSVSWENYHLYHANIFGKISSIGSETFNPLHFAGFSGNGSRGWANLQVVTAGFLSNYSRPSPYGEVKATNFLMNSSDFIGTKTYLSAIGLICNVSRESGRHTLVRSDQNSWQVEGTTWDGDRVQTPLVIADWQIPLIPQAPYSPSPRGDFDKGWEPGFGPIFWANARLLEPDSDDDFPYDYRAAVMNFLYGAGEIERLFFDVTQSNRANSTGSGTIEVMATSYELVYRITFVPALLLVAILSFLSSAIISFYWIWEYRRTTSYQEWRSVDTLRLIVDAVDGISDDGDVLGINGVRNEALEDWAKGYFVRYTQTADGIKLSNQ